VFESRRVGKGEPASGLTWAVKHFKIRASIVFLKGVRKGAGHMAKARLICVSGLVFFSLVSGVFLAAQSGSPRGDLVKKLNEQFVPTKFTVDKSDIVTQGAVVVLKEDGLFLYPASFPVAPISVPKDGKLIQMFADRLSVGLVDGLNRPGGASTIPIKKMVAGEKLWVRQIDATMDSITVQVVTDPYADGRYFATIRFVIPKGTDPTPEDAVQMVSEVLEVQAPQDQGTPPAVTPEPTPAPEPAPAPAPASSQQIAPPPPPDGQPPTIELGQTKDQVLASFGQPLHLANLGPKTIFFYKGMKVTFTNGKVSNIE